MNDKEEPISQHLVELRRRLIIIVIALLLGSLISFIFFRSILDLMLVGAKTSLPESGNIVYTELTEFIGVAMKISLFGGLILALPVIIYQVVGFVVYQTDAASLSLVHYRQL